MRPQSPQDTFSPGLVLAAMLLLAPGSAAAAVQSTAPALVVRPPADATRPSPLTEAAIPDTPAGRMLRSWLDTFNSGEATRIRAYYERHFPGQNDGAGALNFRKTTGGMDLMTIRKSEPLRIEFVVRDRATPMHGIAVIRLADAKSDRIADFFLRGIPPGGDLIGFDIDATTRARVIDGTAAALNDTYVFPETAKKMEADLRARLARGEFDGITDGASFAQALTNHLRAISHDKHLGLDFNPVKLPARAAPPPEELARRRAQMQASNCGFTPAQRLPGNIGLLKFNSFPPPEVCAEAASAAMKSLDGVAAIIVDMRDNGGGSPAMVAYLASYLFDKRTHWNDIWTRKTNATEEFWTRPELPGPYFAKQPVFVLTSARTFSGAEDFSYGLQALKRAVIVGETTGGGAHPTSGEPVDDRFMLRVPYARSINPITRTNWEGTGIVPDVKVPASAALETATKLARDASK